MSELTEVLDAILAYWERVHPGRLIGLLQPGAKSEEIRVVEAELGHRFPQELVEFYTWSKGPPPGRRFNIIPGNAPLSWLSLTEAAITAPVLAEPSAVGDSFAQRGIDPPVLWPMFGNDGYAQWVEIGPNPGAVWENDDLFHFEQTHDTLSNYLRDLLADYPMEDDFPSWEDLEELGFSFPSRTKT